VSVLLHLGDGAEVGLAVGRALMVLLLAHALLQLTPTPSLPSQASTATALAGLARCILAQCHPGSTRVGE